MKECRALRTYITLSDKILKTSMMCHSMRVKMLFDHRGAYLTRLRPVIDESNPAKVMGLNINIKEEVKRDLEIRCIFLQADSRYKLTWLATDTMSTWMLFDSLRPLLLQMRARLRTSTLRHRVSLSIPIHDLRGQTSGSLSRLPQSRLVLAQAPTQEV